MNQSIPQVEEPAKDDNLTMVLQQEEAKDASYLDYLYYHHIVPCNQMVNECHSMEFDTVFLKFHVPQVHSIVVKDPIVYQLFVEFFRLKHETLQFSSLPLYDYCLQQCYTMQGKNQIILERIISALREIPFHFPRELGIHFFSQSISILTLCFSIQSFVVFI